MHAFLLSWEKSRAQSMRRARVRFATTVASGHATLATKRTLLLTWAGLAPAGSHQLCLAHSFNHLVGARQEPLGDVQPERLGGGQIDDEIELGRLLDGDVPRLRPAKNLVDKVAGTPPKVLEVWSIGHQTPRFNVLSKAVHCRQSRAYRRDSDTSAAC